MIETSKFQYCVRQIDLNVRHGVGRGKLIEAVGTHLWNGGLAPNSRKIVLEITRNFLRAHGDRWSEFGATLDPGTEKIQQRTEKIVDRLFPELRPGPMEG